ncbi:TPA: hypothetical protein ACSUUK_001765, partial [Streptococcus pyogenes]
FKENKVKKKLMLAVTLLTVGVATNVKAEEIVEGAESENIFKPIKKQQYANGVPGVTIENFRVGSTKIKVNTPQFWYVDVYRDGQRVQTDLTCRMEGVGYSDSPIDNPVPKYPRYYSGNRSDQWGNYEVQLKENKVNDNVNKDKQDIDNNTCPTKAERPDLPLKKGETVTFVFFDDGNWEVGQITYKDTFTVEEEQKAEEQKAEEQKQIEKERKAEEEQKQLENAMIKHIQEEANKTWYQRLRDSIQDQWWNFKGWLRG